MGISDTVAMNEMARRSHNFDNCPIEFGGQSLCLMGEGMIWIEAFKTLIASDIHFEKSTFYSRFATLLPPYDSNDTLEKIEATVARLQPKTFIALGDSFHDANAGERMDQKIIVRLNRLVRTIGDWRWVTGNHDPAISSNILGKRVNETRIGDIVFRHELQKAETDFEISGHYHPKASVGVGGARINAPCFVVSGSRLVMPAFGSFTGGLSVDHPAFIFHAPADSRTLYLVHKGGVYPI